MRTIDKVERPVNLAVSISLNALTSFHSWDCEAGQEKDLRKSGPGLGTYSWLRKLVNYVMSPSPRCSRSIAYAKVTTEDGALKSLLTSIDADTVRHVAQIKRLWLVMTNRDPWRLRSKRGWAPQSHHGFIVSSALMDPINAVVNTIREQCASNGF